MQRGASFGRGELPSKAVVWIESKGMFRAPEAWTPPNSAGVRTSSKIALAFFAAISQASRGVTLEMGLLTALDREVAVFGSGHLGGG